MTMIRVFGIASSGRASLSPASVDYILGAHLLAGGGRHLAEFPDYRGRKAAITGPLDGLARAIKGVLSARAGARVAVLATGDPLLYGIASFLIKTFGERKVEITPNVSVVQEALSRVKAPWSTLKVASGHGREFDAAAVASGAAHYGAIAVFTDRLNTPAAAAGALLKAGLRGFTAHVCESLGMEDERVRSGTLDDVVRMRGFRPLNVLVLVRRKGRAADAPPGVPNGLPNGDTNGDTNDVPCAPGLPDSSFVHSRGMITKAEVRAVALSKLRVRPGSTVWDVGAGCGSVAVEAALMAGGGAVYAFERDMKRVGQIKRNRKLFRAENIEVVPGEAPASLMGPSIRRPDRVFVGGGGAGLKGILASVFKRALPGCRFVVNAVSMEGASTAAAFFASRGLVHELVMINVAREGAAGAARVLKAGNPVFIISAEAP